MTGVREDLVISAVSVLSMRFRLCEGTRGQLSWVDEEARADMAERMG